MSFRNRSVNAHQFSMIPRADIPRATFKRESIHKTTFDAGSLIPIYVDEVLPGDSFSMNSTIFGRMTTPVFPLMDNLYLETFFFYVPCRLLWDHWEEFMGSQKNPGDSTDYTIPQLQCVNGVERCTLPDYMGLPTYDLPNGVNPGFSVNALPFRAYNLIYNEWFRDQNLIDSRPVPTGDAQYLADGSPDPAAPPDQLEDYILMRRGKRHDYFTSCLPWPSKGAEVGFGLANFDAPVLPVSSASNIPLSGDEARVDWMYPDGQRGQSYLTNAVALPSSSGAASLVGVTTAANPAPGVGAPVGQGRLLQNTGMFIDPQNLEGKLYADLNLATALTINQLRTSFQVQRLLERDARGGTRYNEMLRSHFGVNPPDSRLQRPEYLGGGSSRISITPVAQTSETAASPQGNLAAYGTVVGGNHAFRQSFVEHGYIIGLACVRADLNYQQGLDRMWSRKTRFDFYHPVFAHLGEQPVYTREIFHKPDAIQDLEPDGTPKIFGYQERWAEYRYKPSKITGYFRSGLPGTLDSWHLAQFFEDTPGLSKSFIEEAPPIERVAAAGELSRGQQFIADIFFDCRTTRPMPLYSVPGLIDHL